MATILAMDTPLPNGRGSDAHHADPLLAWRPQFPILGSTTYLISHSLGAMPRRAMDRLKEYAEVWAERGIRAWEEGWWEMPVTVGDLVGSIIGAGAGEVTMQQNVSICQWIAASCFDWSAKRNKLVTDALNFPTNDYVYHGLARQGARIVTAPGPLDEHLELIDEETALVTVSHVAFRNSYMQDLKAVGRRGAGRRARAGRGVRHRRLGEMAVRRAGRRLPVREARFVAEARAGGHGMGRARAAVRLRERADPLCRRRVPLPERHAQRAGAVCGALGV